MRLLSRTFVAWLPLAAAVTGLCLLVYATVQQNYRQSLNDPQIQMAEDAARALSIGEGPAAQVPPGVIDIRSSLAPWIGVYTAQFQPLETNGWLDGAQPTPPKGVFEAAKSGQGKDSPDPHENRITWESGCGPPGAKDTCVRQAIVVMAVPRSTTTYYVVAGRNMREVENREHNLSMLVSLAWLAILIATFALKAVALLFKI